MWHINNNKTRKRSKMKRKIITTFTVAVISIICIAQATPTQAKQPIQHILLGDQKLNGNFEKGLIAPWQSGVWCSSGKKPTVFKLGVTDDKSIVADSKYVLSFKVSGDASGKRVAPLLYLRVPLNAEENGSKLTLSCELRNSKNGFQSYGLQLFLLDTSGKYIGTTKVVKAQSNKPHLAKDKWISARLAAIIPADKIKAVGFVQIRIGFTCDDSKADEVYETFIDNIKLIQYK